MSKLNVVNKTRIEEYGTLVKAANDELYFPKSEVRETHTILNHFNKTMPNRGKLKFEGFRLTDNSADDEIIIESGGTPSIYEIPSSASMLSSTQQQLAINQSILRSDIDFIAINSEIDLDN